MHRTVDHRAADHGAAGDVDQPRGDPNPVADPLIGAADDSRRADLLTEHDLEAGRTLQVDDQRLGDPGTNPCLARVPRDVGERWDRDGAISLCEPGGGEHQRANGDETNQR